MFGRKSYVTEICRQIGEIREKRFSRDTKAKSVYCLKYGVLRKIKKQLRCPSLTGSVRLFDVVKKVLPYGKTLAPREAR